MTPDGMNDLKADEGFRSRVYKDTMGFDTVGYGTNLEAGITEEQASFLLSSQIDANRRLLQQFIWFSVLDPVRRDAIENMAYNIGVPGLLRFRDMIAALAEKDYDGAATAMLNSQWAKQVPKRANRLASVMKNGTTA